MIYAIQREISTRSNYLKVPLQTIYFGGGTPSLLEAGHIESLLTGINQNFSVASNPEITLEANPEDLSLSKLHALKNLGVNRLSIGFQTFDDPSLSWMNRIHSSNEAIAAYQNARATGFDNISIDLIYALPNVRQSNWEKDLDEALALSPEHISLYGLTIENKTVFGHKKKKGELTELSDNKAADQYLLAIQKLKGEGYQHYEVSNFGKPGYFSKHNGAYWKGLPYLGVGPGAHSFDGNSRQFNVRSNAKYLKGIDKNEGFYEKEILSTTQLLNEHILTGLRTANGISFETIKSSFGVDMLSKYSENLKKYEGLGLARITDFSMNLTPKGFLVADDIALELFFDE